jgi:hypothetical protein
MAAPSHVSLRGEVLQYFFYVDPWFNGPAGSFTKDVDIAGEGEQEEVSAYVTNCFANVQWTDNSDPGDTNEMLCMTYNPITDTFAIREGEYVL